MAAPRPAKLKSSVSKEIELEQHAVRVHDEELPQIDRSHDIHLVLETAAAQPCDHLLVPGAVECHMVQRAGGTWSDIALEKARAVEAVDVNDGPAGIIVHPLRVSGGERRRRVATLQAEWVDRRWY